MVRESGGNSTLSRSLSHFVNSPATFLTKQGIFAATVGYWQIRSSARPFFMLWVSHPLISFIAAVRRTCQQDSRIRPDRHQIHLQRWGYRTAQAHGPIHPKVIKCVIVPFDGNHHDRTRSFIVLALTSRTLER